MNKMTIFFIVLVLAFVSFGALVYAGNRQDSMLEAVRVTDEAQHKGDVENTDEVTLMRAFDGRTEL